MTETTSKKRTRTRKAKTETVIEKTRADRICDWIETFLVIPEGQHVSEPFRLLPFQREFIKLVYDNPHVTRQAILSIPRKNGKSVLTSALLLAHLCGPEYVRNGQLYSCAMDRSQAAIIYEACAKMILLSPSLSKLVALGKLKLKDSTKEIMCLPLGTRYRALSSDAKTAHGKSPVLYIYDEIGQVRGPRCKLFEAMETAGGAHAAPLGILISTQAENDGDLLSELIDRTLSGSNPRNVCMLHTCPVDIDPYTDDALIAANPSWSFINQDLLRSLQTDARQSPAFAPAFKNLHLNQRISGEVRFVEPEIWDANAAKPHNWHGKDLVIGLDLSQVRDLTSMTVAHADGKDLSVHQYFWLPEVGLRDKSNSDKIDWCRWQEMGFLETTPGRAIDYSHVAQRLLEISQKAKSVTVLYDAAMMGEFRRAMHFVGFTDNWIEQNMIAHRQGTRSMGPAVNALERALLDGRLRHGANPILTMCVQNVVIRRDGVGNRAFDKSSASRKIDGAVTLAMAIGKIVGAEKEETAKGSYLEHSDFLVL